LIPALLASCPQARIVVYSADSRAGIAGMEAAAVGFVAKGAPFEDLDRLLTDPGPGAARRQL
jgi:hypothetical protein